MVTVRTGLVAGARAGVVARCGRPGRPIDNRRRAAWRRRALPAAPRACRILGSGSAARKAPGGEATARARRTRHAPTRDGPGSRRGRFSLRTAPATGHCSRSRCPAPPQETRPPGSRRDAVLYRAAAVQSGRPPGTPRVTPSAIQDEPTVANPTIDLPSARATCARTEHFDSACHNPYAQSARPLAPDDPVSARRPIGVRLTPSAIPPGPSIAGRAIDLPHAPATCTQFGLSDSSRRNPYAKRTRPSAPDDAVAARRPTGLRLTPSAIRPTPSIAGRAINRPRTRAIVTQSGLSDSSRHNPCAQRTRPPALDDAVAARHSTHLRLTPSAIRPGSSIVGQAINLPNTRATCTQFGLSDSSRRNAYAQSTSTQSTGTPAPVHAASAPLHSAPSPRTTSFAIRDQSNGSVPRHPGRSVGRFNAGLSDSSRRNPYAQRTRPPAPDDAVTTRRPTGLRLTPSAIRLGPVIAATPSAFPTRRPRQRRVRPHRRSTAHPPTQCPTT